MTTKAELEQELQIAEAELDQVKKQSFEQACEIDRLRGQLEHLRAAADDAGVPLALVPASPQEEERLALDQMRTGINRDLQALDELRHPPSLPDGTAESSLDIVRANQRERAELQARMAKANHLLSRIASAFRLERWDDSVDKIVDRVNHYAALEMRIERKIKELRSRGDVHWVSALEWVQGTTAERPALDTSVPRLINVVVHGHDTPVEAKPEHSLKHILELALVRSGAPHWSAPIDKWLVYAEDGAQLSKTMIARELKATRMIATLPVGHGG
jgi:hypothetical protein